MAEKKKTSSATAQFGVGQGGQAPSEAQQLINHVIENPALYIVGILGVALVVLVAVFYRIYNATEDRAVMSNYFEAAQVEEPADRLAALAPVADGDSRWAAEALYLSAETAVRAGKMDQARESYERLLAEHPKSEYAASAAEGLAFLDESAGNLEAALEGYGKVQSAYAGSFTARMQPFNRGRVLEAMTRWVDAVAAYQEQVDIFPESTIASEAEAAMARLKDTHAALFPKEVEEEVVTETAEPVAEDEPAATTETTVEAAAAEEPAADVAPVEEAAAETVVVEETPAADVAPAEEAVVETVVVEEAPAADVAPAEEAAAETAAVEETPAAAVAPVEEAVAETAAVEEAPAAQ